MTAGFNIRVIVEKAVGFAYTNIIDEQKAVEKRYLERFKAQRGQVNLTRTGKVFQPRSLMLHAENFDDKIVRVEFRELVNVACTDADAEAKLTNE